MAQIHMQHSLRRHLRFAHALQTWFTCALDEQVKIAALCDTFEVNCAAHNYHGWLGTAISAHFCAAIPNFKVLEVDVDDVPWKDEIVTVVPRVENSIFYMPTGPVR
jgi:galactonate dehydratase